MARGCCTVRVSNDTPPRQAAVWRSGQPLRFFSTRSLVHPFAANAAFPLKGKQGIVPLPLAPPLGGEGHKVARGCCTARASNDTPPGRPPFGGQGSLCASSLHAASYTLLPLRGISPQGETRDCAAEPCAPLRGRGPQSSAGVLYGKSLK